MCYVHGGWAPQVRAKAEERRVAAKVAKIGGHAEPVRDPSAEMALIMGRVKLLEQRAWERLETEDDAASMAVYRQLAEQLSRLLQEAKKLGIMEVNAAVEAHKAESLAAAVNAALGELGLTRDQRLRAPAIVRRHVLAAASGDDSASAVLDV